MAADQRDEYRVPKGAVIFRQGDPGHEMFVISEGRVRLTIGSGGHEKEVAVLGPGEFFGELALLSDAPRSAAAQAVEECVLLPISRDVFGMMVQDDIDIVFRMMNIQGQRLSNTNQPIQQLMQQIGRIRILAECLRRSFAASPQSPLVVRIDDLGAELGISAGEVSTTLADAAKQGAGALADGRWTIQAHEEQQKLVDVLCRYARKQAS